MSWTLQELTEFCSKPLLAVLATTSPHGEPQATVVWYEFDGESFVTTAFNDRAKTRNIRHNPRVSLCVVDPKEHDRPLMVKGRAQIIEDGAEEATRRMALRYFGEEEGKRRSEQLMNRKRVIIKITPEKFLGAE
ncbi:MAG: PPOX class F420-dependent oxidoreductase [Dehalococcoidia bacterium]